MPEDSLIGIETGSLQRNDPLNPPNGSFADPVYTHVGIALLFRLRPERKRLITDADIDIGFVDARKFGGNLDGVGKVPDVDARYALIASRARQVG